jgi:hypothetical protein
MKNDNPVSVQASAAEARGSGEMLVGIRVYCEKCKRQKAPRGRSVPITHASYCTWDQCRDYHEPPEPGDLWPGETEEDFGYPVSRHATALHSRVLPGDDAQGSQGYPALGLGGDEGEK